MRDLNFLAGTVEINAKSFWLRYRVATPDLTLFQELASNDPSRLPPLDR